MSDSKTEQYLLKQFRLTRIFAIVVIVLVSLSSVISIILLTISLTKADKPSADYVIGQYDAQDKQDFTRANRNNTPAPNAAGLDRAQSVAQDNTRHRLYVADTNNHRVLVYNLTNQNELIDRTADYVLGQATMNDNIRHDEAGLSANTLYKPLSLAVSQSTGELFVLDGMFDSWIRRVLVFDTTNLANNMMASHVIGQPTFNTVDYNVGANKGLANSTTLTLDDTNRFLYVNSNWGSNQWHILSFNVSTVSDNMAATTGFGRVFLDADLNIDQNASGTMNDKFGEISGIAVDAIHNRLYVADKIWNRVLVYDAASTRTFGDGTNQAIAVLGQPNFDDLSTEDPSEAAANNFTPGGIAVDPVANRLYVGDTHSWCTQVDPDNASNCLTFTKDANRVLIFDASNISNNMNAANVLGQPDFTTVGGGSTKKQAGKFTGLYVTADQKMYSVHVDVSRVMKFNVATPQNNQDAYDIIGQTKGNGEPNWAGTSRNNQATNAKGVDRVSGQIVDSVRHRMIIADAGNNRILIRNLDQNNQPIASSADVVIGQPDMYTNKSAAEVGLALQAVPTESDLEGYIGANKFASLSFPSGVFGDNPFGDGAPELATNAIYGLLSASNPIAFDETRNRLFVADMLGGCIMVFDLNNPTNGMNASYVIGKPSFNAAPTLFSAIEGVITNGNISTALNQQNMLIPMAITVDTATNRLFVADAVGARVTVYDLNNIANGMPASYVLGQADFNTSSFGLVGMLTGGTPTLPQPTATNFLLPNSMAFDPVQQRLFVGDIAYGRILSFDASQLSNNKAASNVIGAKSMTESNGLIALAFGAIAGQSDPTALIQAVLNDPNTALLTPMGMAFDPASQGLMIADPMLGRVNIYDTNTIDNGEPVWGVLNQAESGITGFFALILFGDSSQLLTSRNNVVVPNSMYYDASTKTMVVSDLGAQRIMGFSNVKMPPPPTINRPLVITSPTSGSSITSNLTVQGTGNGGTEIDLIVDNKGPIKVRIANNGTWSTPVQGLSAGSHTFKAVYRKPEREFLLLTAYTTQSNFLLPLFGEYGFLALIFQQKPRAASIDVRTGETEAIYDISKSEPTFNGPITLNRASTRGYSVSNSFSNLFGLLLGSEAQNQALPEQIVSFINKLSSDVSIIDTDNKKVTGSIKIDPANYGIGEFVAPTPAPSVSATSSPDPTPTPSDSPSPTPQAPTKGNSVFGVLGIGMGPTDDKAYAYVVTLTPGQNDFVLKTYLQPLDLVRNTASGAPIQIGQDYTANSAIDAGSYFFATMFFGVQIKAQPNSNRVWVKDGGGIYVLNSANDTLVANPLPLGVDLNQQDFMFFGLSDFDFSRDGKHLYGSLVGASSMININTETLQTDSSLPIMVISNDSAFLPLNISTNKTNGKLYVSGMKVSGIDGSILSPSPTPDPSASPSSSPSSSPSEQIPTFGYAVMEMDEIPTSFSSDQQIVDYLGSIKEVFYDTERGNLSGIGGESAESVNAILTLLSLLTSGHTSMSYDDRHLIMPYMQYRLEPFLGSQDMMLPVGTYEYRMLNLESKQVDRTLTISDNDVTLPYILILMGTFGLGNNRGSDYVGYLPGKTFSHSVTASVPGGPQPTLTPVCCDPSPTTTVEPTPSESPTPTPSVSSASPGTGSGNNGSGPNNTIIVTGSVADTLAKAGSYLGQVGNNIISGVKLIPAPAALGFPWLLLFLLLFLAIRLVWQARREVQANHRLRELLKRRQLLNEEETNFVSLASHYLNTPITIIQGAIDVLYTTKKLPQTTAKKLQDMTKAIASKAKSIAANLNEGQAETKSTITPADMPKSIVMRPAVIAALSAVTGLVILSNWLFIGAGTLQPSLINIVTQLVALGVLIQFVVSSQRYRAHSAQDLALVQAQLEQINRLEKTRDEFLHQTVSELSTDVETLRKYLSATGGLSNPQVKDGINRLKALLGRLDLLATIERSAKKLQKSTFSLGGLTGGIKTAYAKELKAQGIDLDITSTQSFNVRQNREMLDLVITAMVDNAIKFAPKKDAKIVVSATRSGEQIKIRVSDNGPGVPADKVEALFKPFSRTQSALKFDYEGQGLSLYLAKLILGKNDGTIALNEKGLKGGATFEITLHDTAK